MNKNGYLIHLSESDNTQFGKVAFADQSLPQKVFSAIWAAESEIDNGGFSQYFYNSSAESAGFVAQAFEAIGARKTADICRRALAAAFRDGLPDSAEGIRIAAADFPDDLIARLEPLDQEFFSYPDNLTELLFDYVAQHPDEFGSIPKERAASP